MLKTLLITWEWAGFCWGNGVWKTFINIKASEIVKYFEEYNGIDPKLLNNEELKITLQIQDLSKQNLTIIESKTVTTTLLTTKKYTILVDSTLIF